VHINLHKLWIPEINLKTYIATVAGSEQYSYGYYGVLKKELEIVSNHIKASLLVTLLLN